jgi:hypothetical protein
MLFARVAAATLERSRLVHLARCGYAGCELHWADFGHDRGKLPATTVADMLREQSLQLSVRLSSARMSKGSSSPEDHIRGVCDGLKGIEDEFGDLLDYVIVDASCKQWNLADCITFMRGMAGMHRVHVATDRTHWGTREPIDRVLHHMSAGEDEAAVRLSLDPAPWMGGPTEQSQDTEHDYIEHVRHLSLSPGWSPMPISYWQTVERVCQAARRGSDDADRLRISLPSHVALDASGHEFEREVRRALGGEAVGSTRDAPTVTRGVRANTPLVDTASPPKPPTETSIPRASIVTSPDGGASSRATSLESLATRADRLIALREAELEVLRELRDENARLVALNEKLQHHMASLEATQRAAAEVSAMSEDADGHRSSTPNPRQHTFAGKYLSRRPRPWALGPAKNASAARWPIQSALVGTSSPPSSPSPAEPLEPGTEHIRSAAPAMHNGGLGHLSGIIDLPFSRQKSRDE